MSADEEALILAVLRVRTELAAHSASEAFQALESEFDGLTLSQVKKACSKASKRSKAVPTATKEPPAAAEPAEPSKRKAKEAARQEQAAAAELKAAESEMMDAQRRLRAAKSGGDITAEVTISGTIEDFIQQATARAIAGKLEPGDDAVLKERIEADITALEWVRLASAAGALRLTEDIVALGVEVQLARLKEVRGAKDAAAARACYIEEVRHADANAQVDAKLKSAERLDAAKQQQTGGELDEID